MQPPLNNQTPPPPPPSGGATSRAQIGFLYLRYVCDPKNLWSWYEPYVSDSEVGCGAAAPPPAGRHCPGPCPPARHLSRAAQPR